VPAYQIQSPEFNSQQHQGKKGREGVKKEGMERWNEGRKEGKKDLEIFFNQNVSVCFFKVG
jgi:hypothetical protein